MKTIYILFFITLQLGNSHLLSQSLKRDTIKRMPSAWWIGESIGGNFNYYRGTTRQLNESVSTAAPFHNGEGLRLYFSFLAEYRPNKTLGAILNVAFNNRSSSFDGVTTPAGEKAFLYTVLRYVNIEPSLRVAPFSSSFYLFAGPLLSINTTKEFFYEEGGKHETRGDWSNLRKYEMGAQGGAGVDIPISKKSSINQITLSPFASLQTNFSDHPRSSESWRIYTIRTGLAVKFSTHKHVVSRPSLNPLPAGSAMARQDQTIRDTLRLFVRNVHFTAQQVFTDNEQAVNEIFPLCHSVFFNAGSTAIPQRYNQLSASDARLFTESQLQEGRPLNWYNNRSDRQLAIYHQLLNILGYRMRNNPQSTITLSAGKAGESGDGAAMVAHIKGYLVINYGIDGSRIKSGTSRDPFITSVQPGNNHNPALRREDDRRVDIASNFPDLLQPFNSQAASAPAAGPSVIFTADDAQEQLQSWSMDIVTSGNAMHYGPYTQNTITLPVNLNQTGLQKPTGYTVQMNGITRDGLTIQQTIPLHLLHTTASSTGERYAVLFDFNSAKTATANKRFLEAVIAPQLTDSSTVIIHGHADIIGNENQNRSLSDHRVQEARQILEDILSASGRKGVKFEYYGFGQDKVMLPFGNQLPEERFYNRTVIIDIIRGKTAL